MAPGSGGAARFAEQGLGAVPGLLLRSFPKTSRRAAQTITSSPAWEGARLRRVTCGQAAPSIR